MEGHHTRFLSCVHSRPHLHTHVGFPPTAPTCHDPCQTVKTHWAATTQVRVHTQTASLRAYARSPAPTRPHLPPHIGYALPTLPHLQRPALTSTSLPPASCCVCTLAHTCTVSPHHPHIHGIAHLLGANLMESPGCPWIPLVRFRFASLEPLQKHRTQQFTATSTAASYSQILANMPRGEVPTSRALFPAHLTSRHFHVSSTSTIHLRSSRLYFINGHYSVLGR